MTSIISDEKISAKMWYGRDKTHNIKAFWSLFLDWFIIAAAVSVDIWLHNPIVYILSVFIIGGRMAALAELEHEAIHFNLFKNRTWNEKLEFLYSYPLFSRVRWYREVHIGIHHRFWRNYRRFKGYGYTVDTQKLQNSTPYFIYTVFIRPFTWTDSTLIHSVFTRAQGKKWKDKFPVIAFHLIVIIFLLLIGHPLAYIKYWLVPFFTVYAFFYWTICLTAHGNIENEVGTRDSRGWFITLFVSPHNFASYHSLHHGYPGIPWFNLPKANQSMGEYQDVVINKGFWKMLTSIRSQDTRDQLSLRDDYDIDYPNPKSWHEMIEKDKNK